MNTGINTGINAGLTVTIDNKVYYKAAALGAGLILLYFIVKRLSA